MSAKIALNYTHTKPIAQGRKRILRNQSLEDIHDRSPSGEHELHSSKPRPKRQNLEPSSGQSHIRAKDRALQHKPTMDQTRKLDNANAGQYDLQEPAI